MNVLIVALFTAYVIIILSLRYIKTPEQRIKNLIRKTVHLGTGVILFFLTFHVNRQTIFLLLVAGTLFSFLTFLIRKYNFIHVTSGSSYGTLFYPVGLLASLLVLYNLPLNYFRIVLLLLSVSDTLANLGGYISKMNPRFTLGTEEKSLLGLVAFSVSAFFILFFLLPGPISERWAYIALMVLVSIHFELISFKGSDNLTLPLGGSIFFYLTYNRSISPELNIMLIVLIASGIILFYRIGLLTRYGSLEAYGLGVYFFAVLGLKWSFPIVFFFLTSVLFTRINGLVRGKEGRMNQRNFWQVLANSVLAVLSSILYLITGQDLFIYFYITLISAVTADTWASELGPVFNRKCYSLSDGTMKESGVTGGISYFGTLAALAGSASISALSCWLFFGNLNISLLISLALSGFIATFIDSLLGAFVEPKMEEMRYFKTRYGPDSLSPNDVVNLLASFSAPLIFSALYVIIK